MASIPFSEQEIRRKLAELGYQNIPKDKMKNFVQGSVWSYLLLTMIVWEVRSESVNGLAYLGLKNNERQ